MVVEELGLHPLGVVAFVLVGNGEWGEELAEIGVNEGKAPERGDPGADVGADLAPLGGA